uniref:Nexin_C domain-containing protein n=1 Tax=Ascaris lumbricoides TaxID=6252 RepID=A0A0M3ILA0_ASCLU
MDEESELDADDIDSLCLLEEVEEPSQRRRLLRGLTIIELNEAQIISFLRVIGKKLASNDSEKVLAAAMMISALCHNLWARLIITMYCRILVKQILEWIPKVRIRNWRASMNRPMADALYHLSRFAPSMQGSTARHILAECQKMIYTQNLAVSGQTLVLEIFLRFGIPYIFELDISKLHAAIGLGPEFHFFISARNSRVPLRCHAEPRARRAYLDFGDTWFLFLSVYYYRALNVVDIQRCQTDSMLSEEKGKSDSGFSTPTILDSESVYKENRNIESQRYLCCIPNTTRLVDFNFLQSICQSEQFPPLCIPLERLQTVWRRISSHSNKRKSTTTETTKLEPLNKYGKVTSRCQSNNAVRMLNAGESVDLDALFGIPLYATAPDDKQVKILMNSDLFLKVKHLSFPQILASFLDFLLFL